MAKLYDRRVSITVNDLEFVNDSSPDGSPVRRADGVIAGSLRMAFKVERSLESKANKAQAQLFNLSEDSRGRITVDKPQFVIEAGYRDTVAAIFSGEAVETATTREATGFMTTVKAADGYSATRARVSVSLGPGTTVGDQIEKLIKSMGVVANKALAKAKAGDYTGGVKTLFNGVTMSGRSRDEMDKLARSYGFDWSIQSGELQILSPGEATQEIAVVLGPDTGLITSPVRVLDEKRPGAVIVRAQSLLQPGITPGRLVDLESVEISGRFKTMKVTHTGDTDSSSWISDFEGIEI